MHRIGLALRAAGKYEEALRCFHNGFLRAPFTDTAPDLLREEAWITCFYLGDIEKMLAVLRQAVAIYPCTDAGRWCSVRLRTHHFDNPPG